MGSDSLPAHITGRDHGHNAPEGEETTMYSKLDTTNDMNSTAGREFFSGAKRITRFINDGWLCHYLLDGNVHPRDLRPGEEYLVRTEDGRLLIGGDGRVVGVCEPLD